MEEYYPMFASFDAYIFATPVYLGTLNGQMANFMDRFRAIFESIIYKHKVTGFITVGGSYRAGQETAMMTMLRKMCIHGKFVFAPTSTREVVGGGLMVSRITDPQSKLTSGRDGVATDEMGKEAITKMIEDVVLLTRIIKIGKTQLKLI